MKLCHKCNEIKPFTEFNKNKTRKDGYQSRCKKCDRELGKMNYHTKYKNQAIQRVSQRKKERKFWMIELKKTKKCEKCGENRWYVLDFHHLTDKIDGISQLVNSGVSEKRILAEIAKCQVLCSNCHREIHYFETLEW